MLKLIQAAAACKDHGLRGKYLAKAEVTVRNAVKTASARVTVNRARLAVVTAHGEDGALTLYLMPEKAAPAAEAAVPDGCTELTVTRSDIADYLQTSGDTNPIHSGEHPVVPGLLLLLRLLPPEKINAEARFYTPAYADKALYIKRTGDRMTIYSDHKIIAVIKEKTND